MKTGTKIQLHSTRFEKVHKEQWLNSRLFKDKELIVITKNDVLTYQETTDERIVFKMSDGFSIFIDKTIFNLINYKQL
jgi:protein associated with RNAse G/E